MAVGVGDGAVVAADAGDGGVDAVDAEEDGGWHGHQQGREHGDRAQHLGGVREKHVRSGACSTDAGKTRIVVVAVVVVFLFVGCLTSQQCASVSQGRICSDNCTCCHTEIEVADPTFYLTQSHYSNNGANQSQD